MDADPLLWYVLLLINVFNPCILMDFPIHIETISMALPWGHRQKFLNHDVSLPEGCFKHKIILNFVQVFIVCQITG